MNFGNIKVALVHDFLNQYGGAERVLEALTEIFPGAPVYTLLYNPAKMHGKFENADIRTSFLQKFPKFLKRRHKWLLPFLPTAPETFNLRDYDLVISSSGAWSKGIIVKPKTIHVCYCHSPMRFAWDWNEKYLGEQGMGSRRKLFARMLLNYVRMWDRAAADRPDYFIANSLTTQKKIKKYYGRESVVIYPPVSVSDLDVGRLKERGRPTSTDYFLIVSRLSPYKKIELAIKALNKLNLPLVIVGEGVSSYVKYLKSIAGPKTNFLGWLPDEKIQEYYEGCRAFLFPGEDDFGITPVEAMNFGKPVIALGRGGATETVVEGVTGEFFNEPTSESLAGAVKKFIQKEKDYNPDKIREHAKKFSKDKFRENFERVIGEIWEKREIW